MNIIYIHMYNETFHFNLDSHVMNLLFNLSILNDY